MNTDKLVTSINTTLIEADKFADKYCKGNTNSVSDTKKVLNLLKNELQLHNDNINETVLRAMHDVGMSSYKEFENSLLETAINDLTTILYFEIPSYKNLKPLGTDFYKSVHNFPSQ